MPNQDN